MLARSAAVRPAAGTLVVVAEAILRLSVEILMTRRPPVTKPCSPTLGRRDMRTKLIWFPVSAIKAAMPWPDPLGRCTGLWPARRMMLGVSGFGARAVLP